jgi:hypothetical protein
VAATLGGQIRAGGELVKLSERYAEDVRYATLDRGSLLEAIFTSRAATTR